MQRRKVLLPEPEGPIMHMTSFGETSRSMPRRTSSRPKLLWTSSALTIGVTLMSVVLAKSHRRFQWCRRRRMEGEEHPPEPLDRCRRQSAHGATGEIPLQVILADRQDRGHRQVPDACYD